MPDHEEQEGSRTCIQIDVIIPCHNAEETITETVESAMHQVLPDRLSSILQDYSLSINVCCYDDGSTDSSWELLCKLEQDYQNNNKKTNHNFVGSTTTEETSSNSDIFTWIPSRLLIEKSHENVARGAGYARNRAAELSQQQQQSQTTTTPCIEEQFLCLLDSDDTMHKTRVAEQVYGMMALSSKEERNRTLLGCQLQRDPPDSTWHYTQWANGLSNDRLLLERFREVTVLQPTWMICRSRFEHLGGYIEAPPPLPPQNTSEGENDNANKTTTSAENNNQQSTADGSIMKINKTGKTCVDKNGILQLIHPTFDNPQTLRLAEDLRFFHSHLYANGTLKLHRPSHDPDMALVTYRHRQNASQSYQTSRKLLLNLRALAFEACVLVRDDDDRNNTTSRSASSNNVLPAWTKHDGRFVVWGAGRDGKDFVKALSDDARKRVYCFVDVDFKKIQQGFYTHKEMAIHIPIVHFSLLAKDPEKRRHLLQDESGFGRIDKSKPLSSSVEKGEKPPKPKKPKILSEIMTVAATQKVAKSIDLDILSELPVVVCVAMYRSNGALERNVQAVNRVEGKDLWHFS